MLEIRGLRKSFGALEVLRGIDLTVNKGDVVAILGSSGSGKTTLLRCLNLLEQPSGGQVLFHGGDVLGPEVNVPGYRTRVGMVFQNFKLFLTRA